MFFKLLIFRRTSSAWIKGCLLFCLVSGHFLALWIFLFTCFSFSFPCFILPAHCSRLPLLWPHDKDGIIQRNESEKQSSTKTTDFHGGESKSSHRKIEKKIKIPLESTNFCRCLLSFRHIRGRFNLINRWNPAMLSLHPKCTSLKKSKTEKRYRS